MKNVNLYIILFLFFSLFTFSEEQKFVLKVYNKEIKQGEYHIFADNDSPIPMQLEVEFEKLEGMKAYPDKEIFKIIQKNSKKVLVGKIKNTKNRFSFSYKFSYQYGSPNDSKHNDSFTYLFPFKHGTKLKLSQGYNGNFTHKGAYALDFSMDIGSQIYAARSGVVIGVKEDSNSGGDSEAYAKYGNYIMVFHDDGTYADYVHLQKNGSLVNIGDEVRKGQLIGYSGNTGYSRGPHLHFQVNEYTKTGTRSVPTKFLYHDDRRVAPIEGNYYIGYNPSFGKVKDTQIGSEMEESDFRKSESISLTNECKVTTKEIDDTNIFYVENGFPYDIDFSIDMTYIKNVKFTKSLPYRAKIPAKTKYFLFIANPENKSESWQYKFKYTYIESR